MPWIGGKRVGCSDAPTTRENHPDCPEGNLASEKPDPAQDVEHAGQGLRKIGQGAGRQNLTGRLLVLGRDVSSGFQQREGAVEARVQLHGQGHQMNDDRNAEHQDRPEQQQAADQRHLQGRSQKRRKAADESGRDELGGMHDQEQVGSVGTEADMSETGQREHFAWDECPHIGRNQALGIT